VLQGVLQYRKFPTSGSEREGVSCCSVLQCVAVYCSVLQRFAVCCSVLQRVAACCSVLQGVLQYRKLPTSGLERESVAHTNIILFYTQHKTKNGVAFFVVENDGVHTYVYMNIYIYIYVQTYV